jgi:hypothetical protein
MNGSFSGRISQRDRRALLLGAAVLLPVLLWLFALRPYRDALVEARDRLAQERALLQREEALVAAAPSLPAALEAAAAEAKRAEMRLVRAANAPLAEEEVTRYLEDIAGLSRVLLQEMRGVEPERGAVVPEGARVVRLALRGESDLQGVLTFLHRVEESPLLLRVSQLSIEPVVPRQRPNPRRRGDEDEDEAPAAPQQITEGLMQFALVVEAYAPPEAERRPQSQEVSS